MKIINNPVRTFILLCFALLITLALFLFYKGAGYKIFNKPEVGSVWYHRCTSGDCIDFKDSVLSVNGDNITILQTMRYDENSTTEATFEEDRSWFNGDYLKRIK